MIYLDNAATGGFKPSAVTDAVNTAIKYLSANPGRSGHRLSVAGATCVEDCRRALSETFFSPFDKIIFTKNCTEALNLAILGTAQKGGNVITTVFEHNSILRPLYHLQKRGDITLTIVSPEKNKCLSQSIKEKILPNTYMVCATAVSNVTGEELPIEKIGKVCKANGLIFLLDGAQGAGHVQIDMQKQHVNLLALAGHKGLYGIMGVGALLIDDKTQVRPLTFGGTGVESFLEDQPECYPERLEAGTLNLPGICALKEGINFIKSNVASFGDHLFSASKIIIDRLKKLPKVTVYSRPNRSGIISFEIDKISSTDVADTLNSDFDIAVRGGFHCAPLMHKFLHTDNQGLTRVSLAVQNSSREREFFINAIERICNR